jgi:hypothetical protein
MKLPGRDLALFEGQSLRRPDTLARVNAGLAYRPEGPWQGQAARNAVTERGSAGRSVSSGWAWRYLENACAPSDGVTPSGGQKRSRSSKAGPKKSIALMKPAQTPDSNASV